MMILGATLMVLSGLIAGFWCYLIIGPMTKDNLFGRLVAIAEDALEESPIIYSCVYMLSALAFLLIGAYMTGGPEFMLMILESLAEGAENIH